MLIGRWGIHWRRHTLEHPYTDQSWLYHRSGSDRDVTYSGGHEKAWIRCEVNWQPMDKRVTLYLSLSPLETARVGSQISTGASFLCVSNYCVAALVIAPHERWFPTHCQIEEVTNLSPSMLTDLKTISFLSSKHNKARILTYMKDIEHGEQWTKRKTVKKQRAEENIGGKVSSYSPHTGRGTEKGWDRVMHESVGNLTLLATQDNSLSHFIN